MKCLHGIVEMVRLVTCPQIGQRCGMVNEQSLARCWYSALDPPGIVNLQPGHGNDLEHKHRRIVAISSLFYKKFLKYKCY